jgi:2-succinyl-6-hydroxy-2,4-cyclohexadiene-1-carboxylate synthase
MANRIDIRGFPHAYCLTEPTSAPFVLVFVHGWLLSHAYWKPIVRRLSANYQCLYYDLRGFGASQPVGDYALKGYATAIADSSSPASPTPAPPVSDAYAHTPAAYAYDLHHLLDALNISNAWLIGHSLGGSIALWAADQVPARINGVICINSGGGIYLKEEFERFRSAGASLVKFRPRWLTQFPFLDWPLTRMNVTQSLDRRWGRQRLVDLVAAHPTAALGALLDSTTEEEVHCLPQVVARLQQPAYFLAGEQDTVMEPQYVNHLASFHASFECCGYNVKTIPDCGHLAMVEHPDTVAHYIRDILAQHPIR